MRIFAFYFILVSVWLLYDYHDYIKMVILPLQEKILDRNAKRYYEDNAERVERLMFTVTIGPENYYLQYDVKVGCYNDKGDGPNSTAAIIYSAEGSEC